MTTVFFDGACHLCSREVEHYSRQDIQHALTLIDISQPNFSPAEHQVDAKAVHKHMHVRRTDGSLVTGVDAFAAIWEALGRYKALSWASQAPVLRPLMKVGYSAFAAVRPYLPKRKTCHDGQCARP